jgi:hypothetical protein
MSRHLPFIPDGGSLCGASDDRSRGIGDLVRPDAGVQSAAAGEGVRKGWSAITELVVLSPLPCWSHLAEEEYRGRTREMVREIDEAAAAARAESLIQPLRPEGVRSQTPETRLRRIKKSSAPPFHALRKGLW